MISRQTYSTLCWCLVLATFCGCQGSSRVEVIQPQLAGRQRQMTLQSDWAAFSRNDLAITRIVLGFPLPGAQTGEKHYVVYVRVPYSRGKFRLGEGHQEWLGHFEQLRGQHSGISYFVKGELKLNGNDEQCRGEFWARCEDGTELRGDFCARIDLWEVQQYEQPRGL